MDSVVDSMDDGQLLSLSFLRRSLGTTMGGHGTNHSRLSRDTLYPWYGRSSLSAYPHCWLLSLEWGVLLLLLRCPVSLAFLHLSTMSWSGTGTELPSMTCLRMSTLETMERHDHTIVVVH